MQCTLRQGNHNSIEEDNSSAWPGRCCLCESERESCTIQATCDCSLYSGRLEECTFIDTCKVAQGECVSTYLPEGKCAPFTSGATCSAAPFCAWWGGMCIEMGNAGYASRAFETTSSLRASPKVNIPTSASTLSFGYFQFVKIFEASNFNPVMGTIQAVTVSIENGYRLYMDFLAYNGMPLNGTVTTRTNASLFVIPRLHQGIWIIEGPADISVFAEILNNIEFMSTSSDTVTRKITWAVGHDTIFSAATRHLYYANISDVPLSWQSAKASCESALLFGLKGKLVDVASSLENNILSWKLGMSGWIGAEEGTWMWVDGTKSTQFWTGLNSDYGGFSTNGAYAAWEPVGIASTTGEPNNIARDDFLLLQLNGYWSDLP